MSAVEIHDLLRMPGGLHGCGVPLNALAKLMPSIR
jgi:hypothetical protein